MSTHLKISSNPIEYFRILPLDILQIFYYSATGWAFKKNNIGKGNNKRQMSTRLFEAFTKIWRISKRRKAILKEQNMFAFSPLPFYILRYSFNITFPCFANSDFQFSYSATGWAFIKHTLTRMHLSRYNRNSIEYFRILPLDILQIFSYSAAGWAFKKNIIGKGNNKRQCLRASSRHLRKFEEYQMQKGTTQRTKYDCLFPFVFLYS